MSSGKRRAVDSLGGSGERPLPPLSQPQYPLQPQLAASPSFPTYQYEPKVIQAIANFRSFPSQPVALSNLSLGDPTAATGALANPTEDGNPRRSGLSVTALLNPDPSNEPNILQGTGPSTASSAPSINDDFAWNEGVSGDVEMSIEEVSGPGKVPYEFGCPLCGAYFQNKTIKKARSAPRTHLRMNHTTMKPGGDSDSAKAIHACGYCCAAFMQSENWVNHVATQCKVSGGWLPVNQVLGIIRRMLRDADDDDDEKRMELLTLITDADLAIHAESSNLKELLTEMEAYFPMSEELFAKTVRHLQVNQICAHQIVNSAYVVSPSAFLCGFCYPSNSYTAAQSVQRGLDALTTLAPSENAPARSHSKGDRPCPVCEMTFEQCKTLELHVQEKHPGAGWTCVPCDTFFTLRQSFDHHKKLHKDRGLENEPLHACTVEGCESFGHVFSTGGALAIHLKFKHADLAQKPQKK